MRKSITLLILTLSVTSLMQSQQIRYCYNIGTVTASTNIGGIAGYLSTSAIVENATTLYLNTLTGGNAYGTALSDIGLKDSAPTLNGSQSEVVWTSDGSSINNGYPVFVWQINTTTKAINFFPDPSIGIYYSALNKTINIEGANGLNINIYNTLGQVCMNAKILNDKFELNVDQLRNGCYIVAVNNGAVLKSTIILKQ